jgi:hypothetical protein
VENQDREKYISEKRKVTAYYIGRNINDGISFWILVESIQANNAGISITSKKFLNERIIKNEIKQRKYAVES